MTFLNISQAARAAGVTPKMVRHYEALGLIPRVERTEAGYRLYGPREVAMLRFTRQARSLGFSMEDIASLLALWHDDGRASRDVKALAERQLQMLEARQRELDQMREALSGLVTSCAGDQRSHCAILERLAEPVTPAAVESRTAAAALKHVAPGTRRGPRPARQAAPAPAMPAHEGLVAWSRAFAGAAA